MTPYPVHYSVPRPKQASRLQLLIRVCAFLALGLLGVSFGSIFAFAFVEKASSPTMLLGWCECCAGLLLYRPGWVW